MENPKVEGKYFVAFKFIDEFDKERTGRTVALFKNNKWRTFNDADDFHSEVLRYSIYDDGIKN